MQRNISSLNRLIIPKTLEIRLKFGKDEKKSTEEEFYSLCRLWCKHKFQFERLTKEVSIVDSDVFSNGTSW